MTPERKTRTVTARLPGSLVERMDFVTRNTSGDVRNRSIAVQTAIEGWLPEQEKILETLGILPKKTRS